MNKHTTIPLERQLNIDEYKEILAVVNKHLADHSIIIIKPYEKYRVCEDRGTHAASLSHHDTLAEAYQYALNFVTDLVFDASTKDEGEL